MKYLLKDTQYYFAGFNEEWPTWVSYIDGAKRYNTKEELEADKKLISPTILKGPEIIEVER